MTNSLEPQEEAGVDAATETPRMPIKLPREGLVRGFIALAQAGDDGAEEQLRAVDYRADTANSTDGRVGTLFGHFAVFNRWTEIDSFFEGNFMESIDSKAFDKTFKEQRNDMRVLFQHGKDGSIGSKPLGPIEELATDQIGARYEVPLLDTSYNRDLLPGLRAGLYGASFRFRVLREDVQQEPGVSDFNPKGIPQRTIKEMQVFEFGPVTFPAYKEATAGVRSLTDHFGEGREVLERLLADPARLRTLLGVDEEETDTTDAPGEEREDEDSDAETSDNGRDKPDDSAPEHGSTPVTGAALKTGVRTLLLPGRELPRSDYRLP